MLPTKLRASPSRGGSSPWAAMLPRSQSCNVLSRAQAPDSRLDRLLRTRVLRSALAALIALVLGLNCVWAAQAVAAWRQGGAPADGQQQLLQRLNSTRLSVEVSRVGDGGGEPSTYVVNAQLLGPDKSGGGGGSGSLTAAASQPSGAGADAASGASAERLSDGVPSGQERKRQQQAGGQLQGSGLVAQWTGSVLGLIEAHGGAGKKGGPGGGQAGQAAQAPSPSVSEQHPSPPPLLPAEQSPPPAPPPHRAALRMPEEGDRSGDACAQALGVPRVALLFLTRGELPHHETWRLWFEASAGMLPREQLRAAACPAQTAAAAAAAGPAAETPAWRGRQLARQPGEPGGMQGSWQGGLAAAAAACGWNASSGQALQGSEGGPIQRQHLFSVYIHAPPNVTDEHLPELFRGRLIPHRIFPQWGTHQLVEAARNLLWEAFKDPLNQRFVLVSESDVPLYDPLTLHQQLLAEGKSRVNACRHAAPTDVRRWTWRMSGPNLKSWHWRKSSQWFAMVRHHVRLVLEDVDVFRSFEEHCWNGWDGDYRRWRDCFSDEHYFATLLASKGLDDETICHVNGVVWADWSRGGEHPRAYRSWEVRPGLVRHIRGMDQGCDADAAIADARPRFEHKRAAFGPALGDSPTCSDPLPQFAHPLPGNCSLTARKFPKLTARAVRRVFTDCKSKLWLLGAAHCGG